MYGLTTSAPLRTAMTTISGTASAAGNGMLRGAETASRFADRHSVKIVGGALGAMLATSTFLGAHGVVSGDTKRGEGLDAVSITAIAGGATLGVGLLALAAMPKLMNGSERALAVAVGGGVTAGTAIGATSGYSKQTYV